MNPHPDVFLLTIPCFNRSLYVHRDAGCAEGEEVVAEVGVAGVEGVVLL